MTSSKSEDEWWWSQEGYDGADDGHDVSNADPRGVHTVHCAGGSQVVSLYQD